MTIPIRAAAEPALRGDALVEGGSGLTAIDLFCGIGGFHLAARENGIEVTFASEIDKAAVHCYATNLGLAPHGDIIKCQGEIPAHDILMAGFPCQPFSIMGKGEGLQDTRGGLVFEVVEIAHCLRPAAIVLENVKRFATHAGGETLRDVAQKFELLGYKVESRILNALDFGVPQQRERVFIVALEKGAKPINWPAGKLRRPSLRRVLEKGRIPKRYYANTQIQQNRSMAHQSKHKLAIWHENRVGQVNSHLYSCSLRAGSSHNYLLVNGKRRLTEREMLRLQGFPEDFSPTGGYGQTKQQVGNAVPVPVASAVLAAVKEALK